MSESDMIAVAMSGGVDSSAVAGIMKEGSGTQYSIMISGMRGYR